MKKILIANRGEIACRIINSCKKLGLQSIAVYSDIDKNSKHVREADESIHIGGSKAQESYLLPKKIIEVAEKLSADAIHPGYGFMAENAEFAQNVIDSGIIWIGPKPETIISMGNKDIARELAIKNNPKVIEAGFRKKSSFLDISVAASDLLPRLDLNLSAQNAWDPNTFFDEYENYTIDFLSLIHI